MRRQRHRGRAEKLRREVGKLQLAYFEAERPDVTFYLHPLWADRMRWEMRHKYPHLRRPGFRRSPEQFRNLLRPAELEYPEYGEALVDLWLRWQQNGWRPPKGQTSGV